MSSPIIAEFKIPEFFDKKGGIKAAAMSPFELDSRKLRREILLPIHSPKIDN
jgi:hypothetical protein